MPEINKIKIDGKVTSKDKINNVKVDGVVYPLTSEIQINLEEVEVTPTKSTQELTPSSEYNGIGKVVVKPIPSIYIVPSGTLEVTNNGTKDVTNYKSVNVNVPTPEPVLQEKTATPTKAIQEITPDTDYDGLSKVNVNPIPDNYIEPSGTIELTTLGEHDVTQYEKANVNVPASAFEDSIYGELNEMTFGEASGYTLSLSCASGVLNDNLALYSLDSGSTWNQFTSESMVLESVSTIRFKTIDRHATMIVGTTSEARDIATLSGDSETEDIEISIDTTWYVSSEFEGGAGD